MAAGEKYIYNMQHQLVVNPVTLSWFLAMKRFNSKE